jgi:hypothetical protein
VDELLSKHAYLLLGVLLGGAGVAWGFYRATRERADGKRDYSFFGPFAGYLERRGGFTRRELIACAVVIGFMLAAIALTVITDVGRRGG